MSISALNVTIHFLKHFLMWDCPVNDISFLLLKIQRELVQSYLLRTKDGLCVFTYDPFFPDLLEYKEEKIILRIQNWFLKLFLFFSRHWCMQRVNNGKSMFILSLGTPSGYITHILVSDSLDCGPPGFSVHGILQARVLECLAIPFSGGYSQPRDGTCVSCISCNDRQILYHWATWEAPKVQILYK